MAKQKSNINTLYVGLTSVFGSATKILNKRITGINGPMQITDDTTTDDSAAPEHEVVYPVVFESIVFDQLVDVADASYIFLDARAKDGAKFFVFWRPDGDTATRTQFLFSATCHTKPKRDTEKYARVEFTLKVSGAATPSVI